MASAAAMAPAWTSRGPSIVHQHLRFFLNVLLGVMTTMLLQHLAFQLSAPRLPTLSASDADFEAIGREPQGLHLPAHAPVAALLLPEQTVTRRDEPPIYQHLREQNSLQRQTETADSAAPNDALADGRVVRDPVTDDAEDAELANSVKSEEVADQTGGAAEASVLPAPRRVLASPKYFLSAMWVAFTRLAGVEHVYTTSSARQAEALGPFIRAGYLTYLPLHHILSAAYNVFPEQN
ncbi:unnamed protein product, partial [Closterium sp. Naga37s-1]